YGVVAVTLSHDMVSQMLEREEISDQSRVISFEQDAFFHSDWSDLNVSAAVHMAFARGNRPCQEIANSLDYAADAYKRLYEMRVPKVLYISSQSVYGTTSEWRTEDCPPAPESLYAMAKYAGEKLLEAQFRDAPDIRCSTLRLDYVIQSQRLVTALCKDAKTTGTIHLKGGKQTFSYIDRVDVAKAIVSMLRFNGPWKPVYNVGPNRMRYTLPEIAEVVSSVAKQHGVQNVKIDLEENDTALWSGMDSSRFRQDTGWEPTMDIYQMVEAIYEKV
ncbi:MAG: NAD(P)-dependent oxidoreductase, partial [Oscillospiraceae bacterium]|nr:NAD(P)-dependent oxidoreductase [Oscillospiraceae bacterium]